MDERGPLLFEYTPLPLSPMVVAELLLLIVVTAAGPFALPAEFFPLNGLCFAPLLLVIAWALLQWPGKTRVFENGIEISLPRWRDLLRQPAYIPWGDVRNVYLASYEVAGAAMSPFASSAGTLVHTGLGIERTDGRRHTVRFTPGSIRRFRGESPGFTYAMAAVRQAFQRLGRPLVTEVPDYTDAQVLAMHEEARRPLVGLGAIVLAFFLPPTIVAATVAALLSLGVRLDLATAFAAVTLAVLPPIASMALTLRRSRRRNWLLGELAKHEEALRSRAS